MKFRFKFQLTHKVLFIVFIGVCVVFLPNAYVEYENQSNLINQDFILFMEQTEKSLVGNLELPIWNFSDEGIKPILSSAVQYSSVKAIRVYDSNEKIFAEDSDQEWNWVQRQNEPIIKKTAIISHGDRKIGHLDIAFTTQVINEKKMTILTSLIIRNLLVFILILTTLYFLVRQSIIVRIMKLNQQFIIIKNLNLSEPFVWEPGDEINMLGCNLEVVRLKLKEAFDKVLNQNELVNQMNLNLEKSVQEKTVQLLESSRLVSLGEMAGGIAHEINTPLAIIQLKASQLRRLFESDRLTKETSISFLKQIEDTCKKISEIIIGLRTFSRDGSADEFQPWSLNKILEGTVSLCQERFKSNGVDLSVEKFNDLEIKCRPVQIGQVLLNLLNNAFDAIENRTEKWVKIGIQETEKSIDISITDCGLGIPTEIANKLMQPFYTTKGVGKGTGLGLSISKGIIESHGGTFILDRSAQNTRFVIQLPK